MGLGKFPSDLVISKALIMRFKDSFLCVSFCFEPGSRPLQVKDFSNCCRWLELLWFYDNSTYWWPKTLTGCQNLEWLRKHSNSKTAKCYRPSAFNEGASRELKQHRFWATHVNRKWPFSIFWRWFRANFQSNRLYNSKEAKEYKFYIIKAC